VHIMDARELIKNASAIPDRRRRPADASALRRSGLVAKPGPARASISDALRPRGRHHTNGMSLV